MPATHDCTLTKICRSGAENAKMIYWDRLYKGTHCCKEPNAKKVPALDVPMISW